MEVQPSNRALASMIPIQGLSEICIGSQEQQYKLNIQNLKCEV